MIRAFAVALVLSCLATSAWAQAQPIPGTAAPIAAAPLIKPAVKKQIPKTNTTAKPTGPAESGPCQIGVIPAIGDEFVYQKIGFTILTNQLVEVPIAGWGLDDLVIARVRAATSPATRVRKIVYNKAALAGQGQRSSLLLPNTQAELITVVRELAGNANCERYVLVTRFARQFSGNQSISGVGILNTGSTIVGSTQLFASIYIRVFDGRDFKIIRQSPASIDDDPSAVRNFLGLGVPLKRLDISSFPDTPAEAVATPAIRDGARALLATSLDKTLPAVLAP